MSVIHVAVSMVPSMCAPVQLLDGLVIVPSEPALQVHWVTSVAPSCDVLEPAGHARQLADDAWPGCVLYVPTGQPAAVNAPTLVCQSGLLDARQRVAYGSGPYWCTTSRWSRWCCTCPHRTLFRRQSPRGQGQLSNATEQFAHSIDRRTCTAAAAGGAVSAADAGCAISTDGTCVCERDRVPRATASSMPYAGRRRCWCCR